MAKKLLHPQPGRKLQDLATADRPLVEMLERAQDRKLRLSVLASTVRKLTVLHACQWSMRFVWTSEAEAPDGESSGLTLHCRDFAPVMDHEKAWAPPDGALLRVEDWSGDLRALATGRPVSVTELSVDATAADAVAIQESKHNLRRVHADVSMPAGSRSFRHVKFALKVRAGLLRFGVEEFFVSAAEVEPASTRVAPAEGSPHVLGWKSGFEPSAKQIELRRRAAELLWRDGERDASFWRGRSPNRRALASAVADQMVDEREEKEATLYRRDTAGNEGVHYIAGYSPEGVRDILKHVEWTAEELSGSALSRTS